jgi:hypothetical protein
MELAHGITHITSKSTYFIELVRCTCKNTFSNPRNMVFKMKYSKRNVYWGHSYKSNVMYELSPNLTNGSKDKHRGPGRSAIEVALEINQYD